MTINNFKPFGATVVYRSLQQVWRTLGVVKDSSKEVQGMVNLSVEKGLLGEGFLTKGNEAYRPNYLSQKLQAPFVVVEGLDGTGKTTLTRFLSKTLNMKLMSTPPKYPTLTEARKYFDDQNETMRRAYYSLGNYLAAQEVMSTQKSVIMDRYWHSTAAYALAHLMKDGKFKPSPEDFEWPSDLLKPDYVFFLNVSEEERIKRHSLRKEFTNTKEEQTLAEDLVFRENLISCYRSITGPNFREINVDGEIPEVQARVLEIVLDCIPCLENDNSVAERNSQN